MTGIRMSMSTTSGASSPDERDRLGAVRGLADDLEVRCRVDEQAEAPAHERLVVGDDDAHRLAHRWCPRRTGSDGAHPEAAAGPRAGLEGAAVRARRARACPTQSVPPAATLASRPRSGRALVGDLEVDPRRSAQPDPDVRDRAAVLEHVGERLLHDAVCREVDARGHVVHRRRSRRASPPSPARRVSATSAVEVRTGRAIGRMAAGLVALAEHPEHPAHLGQRIPARRLDDSRGRCAPRRRRCR